MSPFSSTFPKSPRLASNAPVNKLEPIEFPNDRDFGFSYSKSGEYGPKDILFEPDDKVHDHSFWLGWNSNSKFRVSPGPIDEMPSLGSNVFLPIEIEA
jgi:hypothetical protein